jgi:hypothetical protein
VAEPNGNPDQRPGPPVPPLPPTPAPAPQQEMGSATTSFEVPPIPPPPAPGPGPAPGRPPIQGQGPAGGGPVPPPPVPGGGSPSPSARLAAAGLKPGDIVLLASAVVVVLFSFFNWLGEGRVKYGPWDDPLRPWALIPLFMALFAGGAFALAKFANVKLPEKPLGYSWEHLYLNAGFFAALFTTLFLISDWEISKKIGFWLTWLGSIGLLVGAVMVLKDRHPEALKR